MDLFAIGRLLLRRWAVVIPVMVLTVLAALFLHVRTPGEYEARGYVLLKSPQETRQDGEAPRVDPLDLSETVEMFSSGSDSSLTLARLGGDNYSLSAVAGSADAAVEDTRAGLEALDEAAVALQEANGVPDEERIRAASHEPADLRRGPGRGSVRGHHDPGRGRSRTDP